MRFVYGVQPETGFVHAFTLVEDHIRGPCWASWCQGHRVITWTRWKRAPDDATPTCLGCVIARPR